jgi:hypothetical protein
MSSAYHPESDGARERARRTITGTETNHPDGCLLGTLIRPSDLVSIDHFLRHGGHIYSCQVLSDAVKLPRDVPQRVTSAYS